MAYLFFLCLCFLGCTSSISTTSFGGCSFGRGWKPSTASSPVRVFPLLAVQRYSRGRWRSSSFLTSYFVHVFGSRNIGTFCFCSFFSPRAFRFLTWGIWRIVTWGIITWGIIRFLSWARLLLPLSFLILRGVECLQQTFLCTASRLFLASSASGYQTFFHWFDIIAIFKFFGGHLCCVDFSRKHLRVGKECLIHEVLGWQRQQVLRSYVDLIHSAVKFFIRFQKQPDSGLHRFLFRLWSCFVKGGVDLKFAIFVYRALYTNYTKYPKHMHTIRKLI